MSDARASLVDLAIRYAGSDSGAMARAELLSALRDLDQLRAVHQPFVVTPDEFQRAWHDTHDRDGQAATLEALNAILANRRAP